MKNDIPKIFHQIWLGKQIIPEQMLIFSNTWTNYHPDWSLIVWDDSTINDFINQKFSSLSLKLKDLPHIVQKVDVVKYLVLKEFGGVYVDFDYECLRPIDELLTANCCIGLEPEQYANFHHKSLFLGNAFMAANKQCQLMDTVIEYFNEHIEDWHKLKNKLSKYEYVMCTTGPKMLNLVFDSYRDKESIILIPPQKIAPFSQREAIIFRENRQFGYFPSILNEAYAIHHFASTWL